MLCPDELVTKQWNCCQQNLSSASWAFILPHSKRKVLWFVDFCFWWGPCCSSSLLCCVWFLFYRLRIVHFSICEGDYVHLNIDLYLFINFRYGFFFAHLFSLACCLFSPCILLPQCCQCLWIVHSRLPLRFSLMFIS